VVEQVFFSLSFLSLVDALFPLCPWFSMRFLHTVMSFNEASEDSGVFNIFPPSLFFAILAVSFFSFSSAFLYIFRTRGGVKIVGVRT